MDSTKSNQGKKKHTQKKQNKKAQRAGVDVKADARISSLFIGRPGMALQQMIDVHHEIQSQQLNTVSDDFLSLSLSLPYFPANSSESFIFYLICIVILWKKKRRFSSFQNWAREKKRRVNHASWFGNERENQNDTTNWNGITMKQDDVGM